MALHQEHLGRLQFSPKLLYIPLRPLLLPFSRRTSWIISHLVYFPALCLACLLSLLYGRPLAIVLRPGREGTPYVCGNDVRRLERSHITKVEGLSRPFVEISGYSFVGWGVIAVDDTMVIEHEFLHVENWLGSYSQNKLAFNLVPLMTAGIFLTPLIGLGPLSLALSLALVLAFSLMAFVKVFH